MAESLVYDVLARVRGADELGKLAATSDLAAAGSAKLKESLQKVGERGDLTAAQLTALSAATRRFGDDEDKLIVKSLAGAAAIERLDHAMADGATHGDSLATSAGGAATGLGSMGGAMGATLAAGVALSPVIATLAVGAAGFGAAALGLSKNQALMRTTLAPLKADYAAFQRQLQPVAVTDFGKAVGIARGVMKDTEPVAAAFGKGLGDVLDQVGATLQGGTWTQFWRFMGDTARPDLDALGKLFGDLLNVIPPAAEALQPFAMGLLSVADEAAQSAAWIAKMANNIVSLGGVLPKSTGNTTLLGGAIQYLIHGQSIGATYNAIWGASTEKAGKLAADAAVGAFSLGANAVAAAPKVDALTQSLNNLNTGLLTGQGDVLGWENAVATANDTLAKNNYTLDKNTQAGRDDRQAILNATSAAVNYATWQQNVGHDTKGASKTIQDQINWLTGLHSNASWVKDEIKALTAQEDALRRKLLEIQQMKAITEVIRVTGTGNWQATAELPGQPGMHFVGRLAAGGFVPGNPALGDVVPALLKGGEVVFPEVTPPVAALATAYGLPGFAAGGLIGEPVRKGGPFPWDYHPPKPGHWGIHPPHPPGWGSFSEAIRRSLFGYTSSGGVTIEDMLGAMVGSTASVGIFPRAFASGGLVGDPWTLTSWTGAEAAASASAVARGFTGDFMTAVAKFASSVAVPIPVGGGGGGGGDLANQALGRAMMLTVWNAGQWPALQALWNRESGWNERALNPTSGAYGIPQSLPADKMASAGPDWLTNPATQIRWGLGYILGRYGSPSAAWGHELSAGWYDAGGTLKPGWNLALNTTGREEAVVPAGRMGGTVVNNYNFPHYIGSQSELVAALQDIRRMGRWPQ